jgi:branched-chain amino acid transport system substrate-binding protein
MKYSLIPLILFVFSLSQPLHAETPIKIGVSTALTGDSSTFGVDIMHALTIANEQLGGGRYSLVVEDEQCNSRLAVTAAKRLVEVARVRYVLGFPCNNSLLASAPVYERAGVTVITSSATSGDVLDIGRHIFRLFPSDSSAGEELFSWITKDTTKLGIITEQNEYPVMVERVIRRANEQRPEPITIVSREFTHGETDLRTLGLKLTKSGVTAIFINVNSDATFAAVLRAIRSLRYQGDIYAMYLPASKSTQDDLGILLEGVKYINLPSADTLLSDQGKRLMAEFRRRFGEPKSGFPIVPTTFEAFRVLDEAIQSGIDPAEFLRNRSINTGVIKSYSFDSHGAVQGINFEMQKIRMDFSN